VERGAEVTLVVLVYRSLRWLDWCMEGVDSSRNETRYRWLVVANDATDEVRRDPRIGVDFRNDDPGEPYINRVYRAWNEGVLNSPTQHCILLNSDMYASDHAIDELMLKADSRYLPCGLLVENGRINSGMPEYVRNFGTNPENFQRKAFTDYAYSIRNEDSVEPGRLFQPVLLERQAFADLGGYPQGNVGGVSGDRILFDRYIAAGYEWVTCLGSVWYHCQEGEMRWPA
jgi:hypothetical protein